MLLLVIGLILFLGVHSLRIFMPAWTQNFIDNIGESKWKGGYSLISFLGLGLIIYGYHLAWPFSAQIYQSPVWLKHITALLMLLAFISLAVSLLPGGRLKAILRHPMLLSVKIWAFAHLLANGDLASVLLFGSFLAWAVLDRISLKRRGKMGTTQRGPVFWDAAAVGLGVALYLLMILKLHELLIGASPIAM